MSRNLPNLNLRGAVSKIIASASLALALLGGVVAFTPASAHAALLPKAEKIEKPASRKPIYCPALVGHRCRERQERPRQDPFLDPRCNTRVCPN
ncbi:MAG: hypothetical protein ABIW76_22030 [Fibrobacteria bacterium]